MRQSTYSLAQQKELANESLDYLEKQDWLKNLDRNHIGALKSYYRRKIVSNPEQQPGERNFEDILKLHNITPDVAKQFEDQGFHVGYIKNNEGEIEYTIPLPRARTMKRDANEILSQADPTIIRPTKRRPKVRREKQALIVTDAQMWVGRTATDTYNFHDEKAMEIVNQIALEEQPDQITIVGDLVDFPSLSRFKQEPAYENTLNLSLNAIHKWLASLRATAPNAEIHLLEGNHELRLRRFVYDNGRQLYGLRQANSEEDVLDLKFLLRLSELGVHWHDGYPNGVHWLNDRLRVVHGSTVQQLGKTVTNLIKNSDTSTITGHIHRFEMASRTIPTRHGGRTIMGASFGTLSRIDGAVPSYHSSLNAKSEPMLHNEQWQQGAGWVSYREGDAPFDITPIMIHTYDNYLTRFNGKEYGGD